jgi:prevent-host-death family protein
MQTVSFTEFRQNASALLTKVENGERLIVVRHGKPVAEISPISPESSTTPSWKSPALRLTIPGVSLSNAILEERNGEDVF